MQRIKNCMCEISYFLTVEKVWRSGGRFLNRPYENVFPEGIPKGKAQKDQFFLYVCVLSSLVVGRVRETYETFPGGSLHTFSPERKYGITVIKNTFLPQAALPLLPCCGARCTPWRFPPASHTDRGHCARSLYLVRECALAPGERIILIRCALQHHRQRSLA